MVLASTTNATLLGALLGASAMLIVGLGGLFFQQRNRREDRVDAETVRRVSTNQAEIRTAFEAWQQVNAATAQQAATLNERMLRAEARADRCEGEVVPQLREEVDLLREELRVATDLVHRLQHRVDAPGEGPTTT